MIYKKCTFLIYKITQEIYILHLLVILWKIKNYIEILATWTSSILRCLSTILLRSPLWHKYTHIHVQICIVYYYFHYNYTDIRCLYYVFPTPPRELSNLDYCRLLIRENKCASEIHEAEQDCKWIYWKGCFSYCFSWCLCLY